MKSQPINVCSGVPQGSVLGPLLFLIYINDIVDACTCQIRLFADDVVLYGNVESGDERDRCLQDNLNLVSTWCSQWLMNINVSKCAVMRMTRNKRSVMPKYVLYDSEIRTVNHYKYLGVDISNKFTWHDHIQKTAGKANQVLRFAKRIFFDCPRNVKEAVYTSLVRPILEYACCVWDPSAISLIKELEMVQRRAARFVLGRYDRTDSVSEMLDELKWKPLEFRRKVARLCQLFKLYNRINNVNIDSILLVPNHIGFRDHEKKNLSCAITPSFLSQFFFSKNHS